MANIKAHKGRVSLIPLLNQPRLGQFAIVSVEAGRLNSAQIKSIILTLKRSLPKGTTIIPRISAHLPITKKPLETRMGKGKGKIVDRIARIRPNTIIIEVTSERVVLSLSCMKSAASKLPFRSYIAPLSLQ